MSILSKGWGRRFLKYGRACEHCGKWQAHKICRRDRRRIKAARRALNPTPWYKMLVWYPVAFVAILLFLLLWDEDDPFY